MKKTSLILFIFSGILIFAQNNIRTFDNTGNFSINVTYTGKAIKGGETEVIDNKDAIKFTPGYFSTLDLIFEVDGFQNFIDKDGKNIMGVSSEKNETGSSVKMYFVLDDNYGALMLEGENLFYIFEF